MEITITPISEVQHQAAIEASAEELQPHFQRAYEEFRPKAELRGFRKGKVPLEMVKKLYGEAIELDALDTIADTLYRRAMEEKNIRPLGQPTMVDRDFKRGSYFRFTIRYEVRPAITLRTYRGLKLDKPVRRVTEEDLEQEVMHLRRANATPERVDRVTDADHIVTADVQELDATGAPIIGKKSSAARFHMYDTTLVPEIRQALSSAETGQTYRATVKPASGEDAPDLHLELAVTEINRVSPPALDDQLVAKVTGGSSTTVEAFRVSMRSDLERYWNEEAEARLNNAIADELVREHDFPVPDSLIEGFLDSFIDDIKSRSKGRALPPDFNAESFRAENRAYAVWQAKWMLIKEQIAEAEHITVTDEDFARAAEVDAARMGIEKEKLQGYYTNSGSIRDRLLSEKIMAFLKQNARITETTAASERSRLATV